MGIEQVEVQEAAACTWQLLTVDTALLHACFSAHTERDEMAGFTLPATRDTLKELEQSISGAMEALGTPSFTIELVFKHTYTSMHDVIESRSSFGSLVEQDAQQLAEDEADLPLAGFTEQQMNTSRQLRAHARVCAALSPLSSGADAIDFLTRSEAVHCAIAQIQQDLEWIGHPQQTALLEAQLLVRAERGHSVEMEVRAYVKEQRVVGMEQVHLQFISPGLLLGDIDGMTAAVHALVAAGHCDATCVLDVAIDYEEEGVAAWCLRSRPWQLAEDFVSSGLFAGSEALVLDTQSSVCEFRRVDKGDRLQQSCEDIAPRAEYTATPAADEEEADQDSDDDAPDL